MTEPEVLRIEIVVDSVDGALAAESGGAHRLELCMALAEGGLTPSLGLLRAVRAATRLPVMAMVRPRGGDFLYDAHEFAVMQADAEALLAAGADGIVAGILDADGRIDRARMAALLRIAGKRPFTCHRAFDVARDADEALDALIQLGAARVLTSGQRATAPMGSARIAALVQRAQGRITVLAGGGLRADNVAAFVARTGVREIHLSATRWRPSGMRHRNPDVPMGIAPPQDEYLLRGTDADEIAAVAAALRA